MRGHSTPSQRFSRPRWQWAEGTAALAVGVAMAGGTLVVVGTIVRLAGLAGDFPRPAQGLFVAQAVLNGVVLGYLSRDRRDPNLGQELWRQLNLVLRVATLAMSGVLPLMLAWAMGIEVPEVAIVLAVSGVVAAAILAMVIVPVLYTLALRTKAVSPVIP